MTDISLLRKPKPKQKKSRDQLIADALNKYGSNKPNPNNKKEIKDEDESIN